MSITGEPDGEPQKVGVALVDVLAGLFAAVGILAALAPPRRAPGEGQRVEVDLLSSLLAALVNQASRLHARRRRARRGWATRTRASRRTSCCPTADGELVARGRQRRASSRALCADARRPELADDPRFATNPARVAHRDELRPQLERRLATRPGRRVGRARCTAAGVPAGVVNDIGGAFALAERLGLDPTVEIPARGRAAPPG